MALRLKWPGVSKPPNLGDPDFAGRFVAWWNGEPVKERNRRSTENPPVSNIKEILDSPEPAEQTIAKRWSSERVRITQTLWGAGFNVPGGSDYLPELVVGMTPSAADTLLNIGAGPGGIETATSKRFGAYVESFNPDPQLRSVSNSIASRQGVDEKVTIRPYETASSCIRPGYYTGAILIEHPFREEDKNDFFRQIANGMKHDSQLVGTDLLIDGKADRSALERWKAAEIGGVFPASAEELSSNLTAAGFRIRNFDLDTEDYVRRAVRALSHMAKELSRMKQVTGEFDEKLAIALMEETALWGSRVDAMRAGHLKHVKFVAVMQG